MVELLSGLEVSESLSAFVVDVVAPMGRVEQRRNAEAYVAGMLGQGGRKSLQPVVERQGGDGAEYQSLQQFLADSPWMPEPVLQCVAERVCPQIGVWAWIIDDTGWVKQGKNSPGVKRQYSGTLGKTGNCQIGVSLHAAGGRGTLPLGWSLYLPEDWCGDAERRRKAKIPEDVEFRTKPELALALAQSAAGWQVTRAPVLGDIAYGINTSLRTGLHAEGFEYVLSIDASINLYDASTTFTKRKRTSTNGRPPSKLYANRKPRSVSDIASSLRNDDFRMVEYRASDSRDRRCKSRFAFVRVIAAHPIDHDNEIPREEWLIVEWPIDADSPTDYWISNMPANTSRKKLAQLARLRWMIELDYKQLKGHLGLDHYEGRSWLGWHHHACLVTVAHAWLTEQRLNPFAPRPA